ncbi:MAG: hypothetical protein Kow0025_14210 [Thermodesulfovibrionales bacterium]
MKRLKATAAVFLVLWAALAAAPSGARAGAGGEEGPVIRYGAYCAAPYGFRNDSRGLAQAVEAMRAFFARRGLEVSVRSHGHRFVVADVLRDGEKVDSIILDRHTGKMRSTY